MKSSKPSGSFSFKKPGQKVGKSRSQANVAGYEKRQARKAKSATDTADLYEHIPEKTRRSKVGMELDREEALEYGVGIDGANDDEREALRARLIGENVDDEEIASDDDEEIDSDAAFEESDEDRFAGFFSSKKNAQAAKKQAKPSVRLAEIDLNEDDDVEPGSNQEDNSEEEEEDGDDEDFIDLLDVLDGKGDIDMGSDDEKEVTEKKRLPTPQELSEDFGSEEQDEEESSEDDEDDEEEMAFAPSDDEVAPEALDQLQDFVSNLDVTPKKRKASDEDGPVGPTIDKAKKRRTVKERTEAGDENEFRVQSSGSKLNLDDLLAPLASQSSTLQSLKKSTKVLVPSVSSKTKTLSAPLPQRTQERLDRQAAYEQTKQEVDKWSDTMKRIRAAEHLSFPLQSQSMGRTSNLELTAKFKPTTQLESAVDSLLKSAKMREEDIHETEDTMLKMNNLSVEEVAQRRSELRKMRELMFRAEIKARRVGKIKSKTYRRLRRKEKERLGEKIDENEDSDTAEGRLKREAERATERATLRHKHTGKWARQMRNKEGIDGDSRRDIEDMLARGEKLRRRIQGVGSDESEEEGDDADDDEGMDVDGAVEKIKQGAFDELSKLDDGHDDAVDGKQKGKSVFEMKFMKDAMARQAHTSNKEVDDFIKEMGGTAGDEASDEDEGDAEELDPSSGVVAKRAGGRVVYRPGALANGLLKAHPLAPPASDTSSVTLQSTDLLSPPPPSPLVGKLSGISRQSRPAQESNPWLTRDSETSAKASKKANAVVIGKDSKAADRSKNKLKKQSQKREEQRRQERDDAVVEISMDNVLQLSSTNPPGSKASGLPENSADQQVADDSDSDDNSELDAQEKALNLKGKGRPNGLKAFEQRDLVALAFAGDNVVQSFEDAKRREIASDAPREVDTTIPGWGSWGGAGAKKAPPEPQRIKKIAGIDPTTRADYGKKNIIISEKRDKKAGKYLVKDLPYPYTSKAQFERAMERPVGVEWNTRLAFQRGTLPRVVKKPGIIIDPLEKLI